MRMPPPTPPSPRGQAGFTIIETMVAAVLLLVGLVSTLTLVEQAGSTTLKTKTREQATSLQREVIEAARSVVYDQLTPNAIGPAVRARPALADSSVGGSGWTVRRRNVTYTIAMTVCTVDDPRDGIGPHGAGLFCGPSAAPTDGNLDGTLDGMTSGATTCAGGGCTTPADTNPADYKRIVSLVRWAQGSNVQTSQLNNPGLSGAPGIAALLPATTTISDTRTSLGLTATTTGAPVTVSLYLDGTQIGNAAAAGAGTWSGTWNLGTVTATAGAQPPAGEIVDGSYELSAKAFDVYGQYGATKSQTIVVNRRVAFAPGHVEAGRNGSGVEVEWSAAREHDSEGFRVDRRVNGGAWVAVCARAQRTSCRDTAAPAAQAGQLLEYSVVGSDRDAGGALRDGDRSEIVAIDDVSPPAAPGTPGTLQASLVNGNVVLTWTAPAGTPVPDHYNFYRDGTAYTDRLDSAYFGVGSPLTYTDRNTGGQAHDYWITAVNAQLGESAPLGPVRR